jgi:hypothetical protein
MEFSGGIVLGLIAGGAIIWVGKDEITKLYMGAEAFAASLRTKANAISVAIKK